MASGDFRLTPTNITDLAESIVDEFESLLSERSMSVTLDAASGVQALVDPKRVKQVLRNLLSNAVKFSPAESSIDVVLGTDPDRFRISVADQGIGIPENELEQVLERFVMSSRKSGAGGTGLGLAICRQIVEAHGGRIWAEGRGELPGTRMVFEIPFESTRNDGSPKSGVDGRGAGLKEVPV